jgi:hypothetical protein
LNSATLIREPSTDEGTFGVFALDSGLTFRTAELPWRNNARRVSCIPKGVYECRWRTSPRFGPCYRIEDVPGRSEILFHAGNFAGDRSRGFQTDVEGCILLGLDVGVMDGQRAVLRSRVALFNFHQAMKEAPFELVIA